jgi:poly-gamma-glutamate synthesis protein (capsule biosynthesis protein)
LSKPRQAGKNFSGLSAEENLMTKARRFWLFFPFILIPLFVFSCRTAAPGSAAYTAPAKAKPPSAPESPLVPTADQAEPAEQTGPAEQAGLAEQEAYDLTMVAAGDNLFHDPILWYFYREGRYNFDPLYESVKPYIEKADIAFVNQETVLGTSDYSGYPLFNTPREAGSALAAAGFDVVNHATNHIMDRGEEGIRSTINYWEGVSGVRYLGIHPSEETRKKSFCVIEKNNIRVGFLAFTYGTNDIPLPGGKSYLVSLADTDKMAEEIDKLRESCDFLVVSMHWGNEYEQKPSAAQEKLAAFLAGRKVDLVIGHHPHVLQPMTKIRRPDGGDMVVYYSLGNFASAHAMPDKPVLMGGLMYIKLKKIGQSIQIESHALIPLINHYEKNFTGFKIYPLGEYTEELAEKHWKRAGDSGMKREYFLKAAEDLFGKNLMLRNPFARPVMDSPIEY